MKVLGCVRPVDKLGRLVLPSDIRKALKITSGEDSVEFFLENSSVVIKKYRPSCVFCGSDENLIEYKDQSVCPDCLEELKK